MVVLGEGEWGICGEERQGIGDESEQGAVAKGSFACSLCAKGSFACNTFASAVPLRRALSHARFAPEVLRMQSLRFRCAVRALLSEAMPH